MKPDPYEPLPHPWERHRGWLTPLVAGVLTALLFVVSFPPYHTPEAAYTCLIPGIFWAYLRPRFWTYAWTVLAAQSVAWTINLAWLHPVTWAGLFLLGPIVGVWTGCWYLAVWWTMPRMLGRPKLVRIMGMLGLAGLWVIIEWSRTWLFGGFPWMPLAATQWERVSVLQIAAYTGAYGVSFVLVSANIGFSAFAHRLFREGETGFRKRSPELLLALFMLLVCLAVHVQEAVNRDQFQVPFARVAFVQPDIPSPLKWNPAESQRVVRTLVSTTLEAAATRPDVILWPESTLPWPLKGGDPSMKAFVEQLSARVKTPLLMGADAIEHPDPKHENWYNGAFVVDPKLGVQTAYYAKRRLVQFGEYIPLRPIFGWIGKFAPLGDDFSAGTDPSPLVVPMRNSSAAFGILICYEDLFPSLARDEVLSGAESLVVLTNDSWYGEGAAAYQHAAHSVLRAVENRRPMLRCGDAGWSGWIDEFGSQRKVLRNDEGSVYLRGTLTANVMRDSRWIGRNSFYAEHGDWFVFACACLACLAFSVLGLTGASAPPAPKIAAP